MSISPGDYVQAGIRFLKLSEAEQKEMSELTKPQVWERVEGEAAAVQWVLTACVIWHEQGVLGDVLAFLRESCEGQTSLDVAA